MANIIRCLYNLRQETWRRQWICRTHMNQAMWDKLQTHSPTPSDKCDAVTKGDHLDPLGGLMGSGTDALNARGPKHRYHLIQHSATSNHNLTFWQAAGQGVAPIPSGFIKTSGGTRWSWVALCARGPKDKLQLHLSVLCWQWWSELPTKICKTLEDSP